VQWIWIKKDYNSSPQPCVVVDTQHITNRRRCICCVTGVVCRCPVYVTCLVATFRVSCTGAHSSLEILLVGNTETRRRVRCGRYFTLKALHVPGALSLEHSEDHRCTCPLDLFGGVSVERCALVFGLQLKSHTHTHRQTYPQTGEGVAM